jgi:hypothetical protein
MQLASKPRGIFKPHPVLGWSLTPNQRVKVEFRDNVIQNVGADGFRNVPARSDHSGQGLNFNLYGCSFTYGTGLRDEETLVNLLQSNNPDTHFNNRGVSGYGNVQSYLSFETDILNGDVQAAFFLIHNVHRRRNIPHPVRMQHYLSLDWHRIGVEHVPCCADSEDGSFAIRFVPIWQPCLNGYAIDAFLPQERDYDRAFVRTCQAIADLADKNDIPVGFALVSPLSLPLREELSSLPNWLDIGLTGAEYTFAPFDGHPNVRANKIFAERLNSQVVEMISIARQQND